MLCRRLESLIRLQHGQNGSEKLCLGGKFRCMGHGRELEDENSYSKMKILVSVGKGRSGWLCVCVCGCVGVGVGVGVGGCGWMWVFEGNLHQHISLCVYINTAF